MTSPWATVRVDDLSFGVLDNGDIPIETADWSNGLVAVMSHGAVISTGIHQGRGEGPQDDGPRQFALGGEDAVVGDTGSPTAFAVVGPGLGQVELTVDQGVAAASCVGGEDADPAVLGAAWDLYLN